MREQLNSLIKQYEQALDNAISFRAEIKPIEKDEKHKDRDYFCVGCGSLAIQTAFFKIEGATIVERYCDSCVKSVN